MTLGLFAGIAGAKGSSAEVLAGDSSSSAAVTAYKDLYDVFVDAATLSGWKSGDDVYCHNWNGGTGTTWPGTKMTHIKGSLYGVNINEGNTECKFDLGVGKTETASLSVTTGNTYFNGEGWKNLVDDYIKKADAATTDTFRVFIHNSDVSSTWGSGAETMIRVTGSDDYAEYDGAIFELTWFQNLGTDASSLWYGYADIPTNASKFQIVRTKSTDVGRCVYNWGPSITVDEDVAQGARIYKMKDKGEDVSDWNYRFNELASTTSDAHVGPSMMKKILAAYTTCDMSKLNGVGAYTTLKSNFFDGATTDAKNELCTTLGDGAATVAASIHIEAMKNRQGGIPRANIVSGPIFANNVGLAVTVGIAAIGLAAAGTMVFVAKRRKEN